MEEANKLIGTGKRHLVMGDAVAAVNVLQEACGMLAKTYGDTADECGEAFFLCGKALLELARMENSVLGNALEGVPEEDEEKEEKPKDSNIESTDGVDENTRDELRAQVYDAMEEKKKDEENAGDGVKSSEKEEGEKEEGEKKEKAAGDKEKSAGKEGDGKEEMANGHGNETVSADGEKEEKGKKEENGEKKEENGENGAKVEESSEHLEKGEEEEEMEEEGGEGEEEEEDEGQEGETTAEKDSDDEEVGNLQLAWEMLEVAKVIYKRKESEADQLLAAQAHLKLGEVASESGNYPQAVEDFQECLTLQLKHLPSDSRLLAETHCQLGLTLTLTCQYSQAIEQFNSSMAVINSRLAKLQKTIDDAAGPEAVAEETKEMEELKALLPDIKEKVEDAAEGLKTASAAAEAMKEVLTGESPFPAPSTQNGSTAATTIPVKSASGKAAAASDISHLVRKKRKPEESPVKENDSKKVKQVAHVDGSATNGV